MSTNKHNHRDRSGRFAPAPTMGATAPTASTTPKPVTPITDAPSSAGIYSAAWAAYQNRVQQSAPLNEPAGEWLLDAADPDSEALAVEAGYWLRGRADAPTAVERTELREWLSDWMTSDTDLYADQATDVWRELDALDIQEQMGVDREAALVAGTLDRPHPMDQARALNNARCEWAELDAFDVTGDDDFGGAA